MTTNCVGEKRDSFTPLFQAEKRELRAMTSIMINLHYQEAALTAKATAQGLTLEDWLQETVAQVIINPNMQRDASSKEDGVEAASSSVKHSSLVEEMRRLRATVKPDSEGWTTRDYVNYGRR